MRFWASRIFSLRLAVDEVAIAGACFVCIVQLLPCLPHNLLLPFLACLLSSFVTLAFFAGFWDEVVASAMAAQDAPNSSKYKSIPSCEKIHAACVNCMTASTCALTSKHAGLDLENTCRLDEGSDLNPNFNSKPSKIYERTLAHFG